jgi:GMP synthase (glutamine-hydrolysing)
VNVWRGAQLSPCCRRKTAGVLGYGHTYEYVVGLRAFTSTGGMTGDFHACDMKLLGETATRIINEVKGVNRVVYNLTSKPLGTFEWE